MTDAPIDPAQCPRVEPTRVRTAAEHGNVLRHEFAYAFAIDRLRGAQRVLEVGCGEGYGAAVLGAAFASVECIDIGAQVLERARAACRHANVTFRPYDGERLPFDDGSFDALVSFQVVEHVRDPDAFVRELARVLKPGASAILTTPNRTYRLRPEQPPWNRYHLREYLAHEFRAVLEPAFARVELLGVRGSPRAQALEHDRVRPMREGRKRTKREREAGTPRRGWRGLVDRVRKGLTNAGELSLRDFHVIETDLDAQALDLLAIGTTRADR